MEIDLLKLKTNQQNRGATFRSKHTAKQRVEPSVWQYDYLSLRALSADIKLLIEEARREINASQNQAIDVGCNMSPYREQLERLGFELRTLDLDLSNGADLAGRVEATGLPDASADLLLCTQVLEHCSEPWKAASELFRVVKPGGFVVVSAPHVWFYHPHPDDNWRFTPEGLSRLLGTVGFETKKVLLQGGSVLSLFQIINFCVFGITGKMGAPIFACLNFLGLTLDQLFPNPLFPMNVAVLICKPTGQ